MKVADPDHSKKLEAAIKSVFFSELECTYSETIFKGMDIKSGKKKTTMVEEEAREKEEKMAKEKMAKLERLKSRHLEMKKNSLKGK